MLEKFIRHFSLRLGVILLAIMSSELHACLGGLVAIKLFLFLL